MPQSLLRPLQRINPGRLERVTLTTENQQLTVLFEQPDDRRSPLGIRMTHSGNQTYLFR